MKTITIKRNTYLYNLARKPLPIFDRGDARDLCTFIRNAISGAIFRYGFLAWAISAVLAVITTTVCYGYHIAAGLGGEFDLIETLMEYVWPVFGVHGTVEWMASQSLWFIVGWAIITFTWLGAIVFLGMALVLGIVLGGSFCIAYIVELLKIPSLCRIAVVKYQQSKTNEKVQEVNEVVHEKFCAFIDYD